MVDEKYLQTIPIFNSTEPICVTRPEYFVPRPVVLRIHESFNLFKLKHKYRINSGSKKLGFKCQGKLLNLFRSTKTLVDHSGNPIVRFWRHCTPRGNTFHVFDWSTGREICKFTTDPGRLLKLTLKVEFKDVITERQRLLTLKGDWAKKEALVFLGNPDEIKGGAKRVAKIFRKPTLRRADDYTVEVAANVDIAIVTILAIVFDTIKDNIQLVMGLPNIPLPKLTSTAKSQ